MKLDLETLVEADDLLVTFAGSKGKASSRVIVSFTGVNQGLNGIQVQSAEFIRVADYYDAVYFIADKTRSWGNSVDFDAILALIEATTPGAKIDIIGNSMGGFLAILAARFFNAGRVLAFAPQYSVKDDIVPFERRWLEYRAAITNWRFPSLEGCWNEATHYYVFLADSHPDRRHAELFPKRDNITMTLMPGDHGIAAGLKQAKLLYEVIGRCLNGSYQPDWLLAAIKD